MALLRAEVRLAELKEYLADKTPEWAYTWTTIKPELIRKTARFISSFKPASFIHPGRHVTWYGDDTQRSRAIAIINALLGAWGRKGGFYFPTKVNIPSYPYTKYGYKPKDPADMPKDSAYPFADEVLASGVCDATIPGTADYDIKGWLVYGTNLINSLPDPKKTIEAIQKLELIVAIDILPVEITGWADVVLPESTYLERCDDLHTPRFKQPYVAVRQKVVEPMYDSKPGWWIARELAHKIGLQDYFPWKDSVEYAMHRVKKAGYDCETLKRDGVVLGKREPVYIEEGVVPTFDTPSGKIELYSKQLKEAGFSPVPDFNPPEEPPAGMFRLLFGRSPVHSFGRTVNNKLLCDCYPENELWVNNEICAEMGIKDGQRVVMTNQDGVKSDPIRLKATRRIRTDCVFMVHGFGRKQRQLRFAFGKGANDNDMVTRIKVDPIMGGTGMSVNFIGIEQV